MPLNCDIANVLEGETRVAILDWHALVGAEPEFAMIPSSREDGCVHLPEMSRD